jgi:endonuclease-3 related protein
VRCQRQNHRVNRRRPPATRGRSQSARCRLRSLYQHLLAAYGPQQWWPAKTPLEVVIGAYLTQNTAWTSVEKSIANLAAHNLLTLDALRAVSEGDLRAHIRPSGYMIRKAAAIKAFVAFLDRDQAGSFDQLAGRDADFTRTQLLALPGVGPETADAILLYALHQPAMVVDEYLRRVVTRHRLIVTAAPTPAPAPSAPRYHDVQQLALSAFRGDPPALPPPHYNEFHALIVQVGKRHCRRTPRCEECPLAFDLPPTGRRATDLALADLAPAALPSNDLPPNAPGSSLSRLRWSAPIPAVTLPLPTPARGC